jgi:tripartite-type tricarboxylate transporter receptor subunit TctC
MKNAMKPLHGFLLTGSALAVLLSVGIEGAQAQAYPSRPIEVINQYPPGGIADNSLRAIQNLMMKELGATLVPVTKAGAGGAIATDFVKKAPPDGYTVLNGANPPMTTARALNPNITYKISDFIVIGRYSLDPSVIVSKRNAPWKNFDEFIAYAKANPGKLSYGNGGMGGAGHFQTEMLKQQYGLSMEPIHYQGSGAVKAAILGGHVDVVVGNFSSFASNLPPSGDLLGLVSSASRRHATVPDMPLLSEKGAGNAALSSYMMLLVPAGTPQPVVATLSKALAAVMRNPEAAAALERVGMVVDYADGPSATRALEDEYARATAIAGKITAGKK